MKLHKGNLKKDPLKANAMLSYEGQKKKKRGKKKRHQASCSSLWEHNSFLSAQQSSNI